MLKTIKNAIFGKPLTGGWRYKGITNSLMNKHEWSDGTESVSVYHMNGAGHHAGFVAEVTGRNRNARLQLANGFVSFSEALILADMYMRDDHHSPSAFMHSDRVESDHAPGSAVRQDEWLDAHGPDYEFGVIDPSHVRP